MKDLAGCTFGHWSVLRRGARERHWLCRCTCGKEKEVLSSNLTGRKSESCGCVRDIATGQRATRHGYARAKKSAEYRIWVGIITRCENTNNPSFPKYGGRGIAVCARWRGSFELFLADMGPRPSPKHSIDRIDNNGNYEPGNCRWATNREQSCNTRRNVRLTHGGETMVQSDWAARLRIGHSALRERIKRWGVEAGLSTAKLPNGTRKSNQCKRGHELTVSAGGTKRCLECNRNKTRRYRERQAAQRTTSP